MKSIDEYTKLIMAMSIFKKYDTNPDLNIVDDIIYTGPSPDKIPPEKQRQLKTLGWDVCKEYNCFERTY